MWEAEPGERTALVAVDVPPCETDDAVAAAFAVGGFRRIGSAGPATRVVTPPVQLHEQSVFQERCVESVGPERELEDRARQIVSSHELEEVVFERRFGLLWAFLEEPTERLVEPLQAVVAGVAPTNVLDEGEVEELQVVRRLEELLDDASAGGDAGDVEDRPGPRGTGRVAVNRRVDVLRR